MKAQQKLAELELKKNKNEAEIRKNQENSMLNKRLAELTEETAENN